MRGRLRAALVVALAALLPLMGWVSGAVVALVTLRRGLLEGALIAGAGFAALGLLFSVLAGQLQLPLVPLLELWLPVVVLAAWLRYTVSLAATLQLAAGIAGAGLLLFYATVPDPEGYWQPLLDSVGAAMAPDAAEAWMQMSERLRPLMTAIWALILLTGAVCSLLLGRWWQALLYNPGGFKREFMALDLGRVFAAVAAVLLVLAATTQAGLAYDLAIVVSVVFALQGLSLAHAWAGSSRAGGAGLVIIYLLLPLLLQVVALVGMADAAFKWRRRLKLGAGS